MAGETWDRPCWPNASVSQRVSRSLSLPLVWSLSSMASGWEIAGLFSSSEVVIKSNVKAPSLRLRGPHRLNLATTSPLCDITHSNVIQWDLSWHCNNSECECIWGGKDQEMCIEKIRKWEDTAMSQCVNGWLICSPHLRLDDLHWAGPEGSAISK